jgi:TP901 family phage tail tape measure protein
MANTYNITINVTGDANDVVSKLSKGLSDISSKASDAIESVGGVASSFGNLSARLLGLNQAVQSIQGAVSGLKEFSQAGMTLNTSLTELSALTGVTGGKLDEIEASARKMAKTFGGSAADSVTSYKLVLSQLGPEIAQVPEALAAMGKNITILSKTMGNDVTGAAEVLTTAMNQYQVSLADPMEASKEMARMMNVMAAAAQAGSAELPAIKAALEQCGMAANTAGISFEEMNAAIQVLDKAGKKAAEGGVALRNVLATLAMGRFLPQDVLEEMNEAGIDVMALTDKTTSLADKLDLLKPLMNDTALITKLFGKENSNAAIALISGTDAMREYTDAVSGTASATDQATIVMTSKEEQMKRFQASIDNIKISIFNATGNFVPFVAAISETLVPISQMIPLITLVGSGLGKVFRWVAALIPATTQQLIVTGAVSLAQKIGAGIGTLYGTVIAGLTTVLGSATAAAIAFWGALTLGIGAAVAAVIVVITKLADKHKQEAAAAKDAANAEKTENEAVKTAQSDLMLYKTKLDDVIKNKRDEKEITKELNDKYGTTFGTYSTAAKWLDVLTNKTDIYCKSLLIQAQIEDTISRLTPLKNLIDAGDNSELLAKSYNELESKLKGLVSQLSSAKAELKDNADGARSNAAAASQAAGAESDRAKSIQNIYAVLPAKIKAATDKNLLFGDSEKTLSDKTKIYRDAIVSLIDLGVDPENEHLQKLIQTYNELNQAQSAATRQTDASSFVPVSKGTRTALTGNATTSTPVMSTNMEAVLKIRVDGLDAARRRLKDLQDMLKVAASPEERAEIQKKIDAYTELLSAYADTTTQQYTFLDGMNAVSGAMQDVAGVVDDSTASWLNWGAKLLSTIAASIPALQALFQVQGATAAAGAAASVSSIPYVGPIMAIAAIASIVAAIAAIPKFAEGGIAYGPTLGMFGEYPNASSNPEVVAPLNKLTDIFNKTGSGKVVFRIKGRTLEGVLEQESNFRKRIG